MTSYLDLADYRRRVFGHYAAVRANPDPAAAWADWRSQRDNLFLTHPQTPLEPHQRVDGYVTPFAAYDPDYRVLAQPIMAEEEHTEIGHSGDGSTAFQPFAHVEVALPSGDFRLTLYWLQGYGGGIFLPFRDATSGTASYGGGRYLLDTVKGADLGAADGQLVLDFNFAYHPSCVYSSRWSCPLAPPDNHLDVPIPVGEQLAG